MATTARRERFPRGALIGAAALMAFSFMAALTGRMTGIGKVTSTSGTVVASRDLRFEDGPQGEVVIRLAGNDHIVETLAPNSNHFVRGTMRGLVRERKREKIGPEPAFRLSRMADGRLMLDDPATNKRVDLDAFGRSNVGAFSAIMDAAMTSE